MPRLLFLFFLTVFFGSQSICAEEKKGKIEVIAKHLQSSKTTVRAIDEVIVYYEDSVIKASSAFYDKQTKKLILDGQVEMIGYEGTKTQTNHLEIQTDTKEVHFQTLFFVTENDIWLYADKASKKEGNYTLGQSIFSSCDMNDPVWKMVFSRSLYDSEAKYMKIYDAKVYLWDIPVFYSPYLGFSTHKERSSGLLFPLFGYSSEEGFVYEQPIFWAISSSMDFEINPQMRTNRSKGIYGTLRFADSNNSFGQLRTGYFRDNDENQLEHYGAEFLYDSSSFFDSSLPQGLKDGLYVNATYLNDIDYLNLQKTHLEHFGLLPLQESRLNYFLYNDDHYAGINGKYFIDTRNESNANTLQVLPSLQWHKYLNHFVWNNLTYSVDAHINHFYRKEGVTLKQAETKMPLEWTNSFFDGFVNLSLSEEFYYSKFFFGNGSYEYDKFEYYSNTHKVKFFSDLTKSYTDFIHVLQPSFGYVKPGNEHQDPTYFEWLTEAQKMLFEADLPEEYYDLSLGQYFYDAQMKLIFFQRLSQKYYTNREYKFADISNEMQYNWKNWQFYNDIVYSYEFNKIRESSSLILMAEDEYHLSIGHSFRQKLPDDIIDIAVANDINFDFRYDINKRVAVNGGITYNIDNASNTQWRAGASYNRDCWNVATFIGEEVTPRPTGYTKDNIFYVQFNFKPFGGIGSGELEKERLK
ncbi:MAG TPA: organic solvent tolerance protein [Sulfurovum sp. UBA12169]|nr:MAG TPA: organic solvent tolerance protein [Sulfurovum sp. UBA12169]